VIAYFVLGAFTHSCYAGGLEIVDSTLIQSYSTTGNKALLPILFYLMIPREERQRGS
jgi:hypothetical protein